MIFSWIYIALKCILRCSLKQNKGSFYNNNGQRVRKPKKLLGSFFVEYLLILSIKTVRHRLPLRETQSKWKEKNIIVKIFLKKIFLFSIISVKPVLLGMKGRIRYFLLRLLCRGEVIPFGTDQTGKGYCAQKVL